MSNICFPKPEEPLDPHEVSVMAERDEKLYLRVFREIRSLIISENMQPGEFLPAEHAIAARLGVSRNVVREAIKSMELMGMVKAVPGRGTEIQTFSLDFVMQNVLFFHVAGNDEPVREMFDIRKRLELSYMRDAFQALEKEDIRELRDIVDRIRVSYEQEGVFSELDRAFHMTLFRSLHNSVLNSVMDAIWAVDVGFQLEEKRPHLSSSVAKHEAIVKALEEYDYIAFAKAMERHFSSGKYTRAGSYTENEEA